MLIVLVILLSVTGLAVFAVNATSSELRAAGNARHAMQAEYVAQAGVDSTLSLLDNPRFGPGGLHQVFLMIEADGGATYANPEMEPFEPELGTNSVGYRMFSENYTAFGGFAPTETAALSGSVVGRQPYTPSFEVDVYDRMDCSRPIPGAASGARLRYSCMTLTSRGRMRLGADYGGTAAIDTRRTYHEALSQARAYAVAGPF
jgi:hypothetical protein